MELHYYRNGFKGAGGKAFVGVGENPTLSCGF
jgi:hypothetical protein